MSALRVVPVAERRARVGRRHLLAAPGPGPAAVADALVAVHATDASTVHVSVAARSGWAPPDALEGALYDERSLVKMIGMRRTLFAVPVALAPVVEAACATAVAAREAKVLLKLLRDDGGYPDPEAFVAEAQAAAMAALAELGSATGAELSAAVPVLRTKITMNEGKAYGGTANVTNLILGRMSMDGLLARGRPKGSWTSGQVRWSRMDAWLPDGIASLEPAPATAALVDAYLCAYGPATTADVRWWTGLGVKPIVAALSDAGAVPVDVDGGPAWLAADDTGDVAPPDPWAALLPALDATSMGWTERAFYLGEHRARLFDSNGNIGPTVWVDGRIVGGWAQRKDGPVVVGLLESLDRRRARLVDDATERLQSWLGPARVTPRFRTPLERELAG